MPFSIVSGGKRETPVKHTDLRLARHDLKHAGQDKNVSPGSCMHHQHTPWIRSSGGRRLYSWASLDLVHACPNGPAARSNTCLGKDGLKDILAEQAEQALMIYLERMLHAAVCLMHRR